MIILEGGASINRVLPSGIFMSDPPSSFYVGPEETDKSFVSFCLLILGTHIINIFLPLRPTENRQRLFRT